MLKNKSKELAFKVYAYVIMADHIHLLLNTGKAHSLAKIINHIKGASARICNQILGTTGQPFWQDGFIDSYVDSQQHLIHCINYIHMNPVAAGICRSPEEYDASSAIGFTRYNSIPSSIIDSKDGNVARYIEEFSLRFLDEA